MNAYQPSDIDRLKRDHSMSSVVGHYVDLVKDGTEFRSLCPFHKEKTSSFTVVDTKGWAHCFGCGWHGDIIAFLRDKLGVGFNQACEILEGERIAPTPFAPSGEVRESKNIYSALRVVAASAGDIPKSYTPLRCWNPKRAAAEPGVGWTTYHPTAVYPYYDAAFALVGIVLRIDLDGGAGKLTPQLQYVMMPGDGELVWSHKPFDRPAPMYGVELLRSTSDEVLWVEGEKCADVAREIGYTAVAHPGGGKNVKHSDFSGLAGRPLLVWGDADKEGMDTMLEVCALAQNAGAGPIRYLPWDREKPKGWDIADAIQKDGWTPDEVADFIARAALHYLSAEEQSAFKETQDAAAKPERPFTVIDGGLSGGPTIGARPEELPLPFRILGHNHGKFYYMPTGTQQIVDLSATQHTVSSLLNVAPLAYWEQVHPHKTRRFDLTDATDALMRRAETVGIFDIDRMRGRGAWLDAGKPVVHMGDRVLHGGGFYRPALTPSHFLYEAGKPIEIVADATAAKNGEAHRLVDICRSIEWETPLSGDLLAGWCIIAPVCGALHWRPHIWVAGPAQTFKTTIRNTIIKPMLGPGAIYRDGSTTEAHIRQTLYHDAFPVLIDEADAEDKTAAIRIKQMLNLSRVASSGGSIGKGGQDGQAIDYQVRTCMGFVSINPSVSEYADETRISKLVTKRYDADDLDEHFAAMEKNIGEIITPAFSAAMFARTIANLPTLLENIAILTRAARAFLRDGRAADQIGSLLGGLYLCHSTEPIAYDTALAFIRERDWGEHTAINATNDEFRLLRAIAVSVRSLQSSHGRIDRTIGELILQTEMPNTHVDLTHTDIASELGRIGIKVLDRGTFVVANNSPQITRILDGTPWAADWRRGLRALPGAKAGKPTHFSPGFTERCTELPLSLLTATTGLKLEDTL